MASNLEDEIESLQDRISALKKQLDIYTSTLITAPSTRRLLTGGTHDNTATADASCLRQKLLAQSDLQQAHNQQCLYRACASVTTFRTQDPDPRAVDGGAVLGLRVEVVSRARFLRPYYAFLNRPYPRSRGHLRVHRHTLPPCIPLAGLARRYLPAPSSTSSSSAAAVAAAGAGAETQTVQDLGRFVRALRREVVRYHHRLGVVADLRKAAGLGGKEKKKKKQTEDEETEGGEDGREGYGDADDDAEQRRDRIVDISAADAEVKQLTVEWADGRTGRLVMGDDGEIIRLVVVGDNGRDREAGRELLGGAATVQEVVKRLTALA